MEEANCLLPTALLPTDISLFAKLLTWRKPCFYFILAIASLIFFTSSFINPSAKSGITSHAISSITFLEIFLITSSSLSFEIAASSATSPANASFTFASTFSATGITGCGAAEGGVTEGAISNHSSPTLVAGGAGGPLGNGGGGGTRFASFIGWNP